MFLARYPFLSYRSKNGLCRWNYDHCVNLQSDSQFVFFFAPPGEIRWSVFFFFGFSVKFVLFLILAIDKTLYNEKHFRQNWRTEEDVNLCAIFIWFSDYYSAFENKSDVNKVNPVHNDRIPDWLAEQIRVCFFFLLWFDWRQ